MPSKAEPMILVSVDICANQKPLSRACRLHTCMVCGVCIYIIIFLIILYNMGSVIFIFCGIRVIISDIWNSTLTSEPFASPQWFRPTHFHNNIIRNKSNADCSPWNLGGWAVGLIRIGAVGVSVTTNTYGTIIAELTHAKRLGFWGMGLIHYGASRVTFFINIQYYILISC